MVSMACMHGARLYVGFPCTIIKLTMGIARALLSRLLSDLACMMHGVLIVCCINFCMSPRAAPLCVITFVLTKESRACRLRAEYVRTATGRTDERRAVLLRKTNEALPNFHVSADAFAKFGDDLRRGVREGRRAGVSERTARQLRSAGQRGSPRARKMARVRRPRASRSLIVSEASADGAAGARRA
jgi:hypothetical protein